MDFLPQERERGITISSAAIVAKWKDTSINVIDTPGHVDFMIEVERSVRVMDGAVVIIDAVAGVQAQTRTVWKQAERRNLPAVIFVNKMDREGASLTHCLNSLRQKLQLETVCIQYPIFKNDTFSGIIDLITCQYLIWDPTQRGGDAEGDSVWQCVQSTHEDYENMQTARREMLESIAVVDEEFLEEYMSNDMKVSNEIVKQALTRCCKERKLFPVLHGSSLRGRGIEPLLDAIVSFLPCPAERDPFQVFTSDTSKDETPVAMDMYCNNENLYALAFKVIHDVARGTMVFVRVYSGTLVEKKPLFNTSTQVKDIPNQVLHISADTLIHSGAITAGNIGCIVGLKNTSTGDTLVQHSTGRNKHKLSGLTVPPTVFSVSVEPEKSSQQQDLIKALSILQLEDPSLHFEVDDDSGQTLIRGLGELHLDIVCDKLRRQYNISVRIGDAHVAYRESIESTAVPQTFTHTIDRVVSGSRMFASLVMTIGPSDDTRSNKVHIDKELSKKFTPQERYALLDGLDAYLQAGFKGHPLVGLHVTITDIVKDSDTTEGAVRACVVGTMQEAMKNLPHVFLEPVMSLDIELPEEYVGDTLSDLSVKRRALIKDVTSLPYNFSSITGTVPLATMLGYATSIRSMTHGQGSFSMEYLCHQPVESPFILS